MPSDSSPVEGRAKIVLDYADLAGLLDLPEGHRVTHAWVDPEPGTVCVALAGPGLPPYAPGCALPDITEWGHSTPDSDDAQPTALPPRAPLAPRRFRLLRTTDVTGVSGTGHVADGILWADGTAEVRWLGDWPTTQHHDRGRASVAHIHGHGGSTRVEWLDVDYSLDPVDADLKDIQRRQDNVAQTIAENVRDRQLLDDLMASQRDVVQLVEEVQRLRTIIRGQRHPVTVEISRDEAARLLTAAGYDDVDEILGTDRPGQEPPGHTREEPPSPMIAIPIDLARPPRRRWWRRRRDVEPPVGGMSPCGPDGPKDYDG